MTRPILVGIAGGSGSGKTTVAEKIMHETTQPVVFLKQDSYYRNFDGMSADRASSAFDPWRGGRRARVQLRPL